MNAFLTFVRKNDKEIHMLGIDNPVNISEIFDLEITSGQPVICIIENTKLVAIYFIYNDGELNQVYGTMDYLFQISTIMDLTIINLTKYNTIKFNIINILNCLSLNEFPKLKDDLLTLENKIFYNLLHAEIELYKIKNYIKKEIKKSNLKYELKIRLISQLSNINKISKQSLRKKIDLNLSGYNIYIKNQFKIY